MKDNDLIDLMAKQVEAAIALAGWDFPVIQLEQPTQQGTNSGGTVYFQKLGDKPYGWTERQKEFDSVSDSFKDKENQAYETSFQISALYKQIPGMSETQPTASDVINFIKQYLCHRQTIAKLRSVNVGILRVVKVDNNYFHNDLSQFQFMPAFQIVFTHVRDLTLSIPKISRVEGEIFRV